MPSNRIREIIRLETMWNRLVELASQPPGSRPGSGWNPRWLPDLPRAAPLAMALHDLREASQLGPTIENPLRMPPPTSR